MTSNWKPRTENTHNCLTALCLGLQKKYSPTHTHLDHQTSFINYLHLLWSITSSLFNLLAWQSISTISLQVLFGLPLGLGPCSSYSMHFFTQSLSSFCNTCPYRRKLFCCSTEIMSNLSLWTLLGNMSSTFKCRTEKWQYFYNDHAAAAAAANEADRFLLGVSICSVSVQVIIVSCWRQKSQKPCDDWVTLTSTSVSNFYQRV